MTNYRTNRIKDQQGLLNKINKQATGWAYLRVEYQMWYRKGVPIMNFAWLRDQFLTKQDWL